MLVDPGFGSLQVETVLLAQNNPSARFQVDVILFRAGHKSQDRQMTVAIVTENKTKIRLRGCWNTLCGDGNIEFMKKQQITDYTCQYCNSSNLCTADARRAPPASMSIP